jgi:F0F1-type ATP synthase assembly protein I
VELKARQDLYSGFGNALQRAIEIVGTPLLLGLLGGLIDRRLGTSPVFLVALALFGVVGMGLRLYYAYVRDMDAHDKGAPWARK